MKILHTADIHLREYGDEQWRALQKLIEIGKKEKVDIFVISGDLLNKEVDAENLRPKIREIFSHNGFKIIVLPGNHDGESYKSGMYFGEDTIILNDLGSSFEYENVKVWGIPFEPIAGEEILERIHSLKDEFGNLVKTDYRSFLASVSSLLEQARRKTVRQVNTVIT